MGCGFITLFRKKKTLKPRVCFGNHTPNERRASFRIVEITKGKCSAVMSSTQTKTSIHYLTWNAFSPRVKF